MTDPHRTLLILVLNLAHKIIRIERHQTEQATQVQLQKVVLDLKREIASSTAKILEKVKPDLADEYASVQENIRSVKRIASHTADEDPPKPNP